MKNQFFIILILFLLKINATFSQGTGNGCVEVFDNYPLSSSNAPNWVVNNGTLSIVNTIPKVPPSKILCGFDGSNASWMSNSVNYKGDWIKLHSKCELCFDIRYDPGDNSQTTGNHIITIFNKGGLPIYDPLNSLTTRSVFQVPLINAVGNAWKRICIPIDLSSATGTLPSNSYGTWTTPIGPNSWNYLISNVDGISFSLDFAGGMFPSEKVYVDSICFESCPQPCCPVFRPTVKDTQKCTLQFNYLQQPPCEDSIQNIMVNVSNGVIGSGGITSSCTSLGFSPASYIGLSSVTLLNPCTGPGLGFLKLDLDAIDCTKPIIVTLKLTMKNGKVCEAIGDIKCPCPVTSCCPKLDYSISYCPPNNAVKHCKITITDVNPTTSICKIQMSYAPLPGPIIPSGLMLNGIASGTIWNSASIPAVGNLPPLTNLIMYGLTVNASYIGTTDIKITLCDGTMCTYKIKWKGISPILEPVIIDIGNPKIPIGSVLTAHTVNIIKERKLSKPIKSISIGYEDSTEIVKNNLEAFAMSGSLNPFGEQPSYLAPTNMSWQTKTSWHWDLVTDSTLEGKNLSLNIVMLSIKSSVNTLRYTFLDEEGEIMNTGVVKASSANGTVITAILDDKNSNKSIDNISLSPNPTNDQLEINYYLSEAGETKVYLLSNLGSRLKLIEKDQNAIGWHHTQLSTQDLTAGVYFIEVQSKEVSSYKKFVVIK
ncbi:MAG: T9SS type A sorting domain-containing protein [Saprospiraceae bacterium]|nr:T9SS type A sorting domain-containing protein [Saprospiraceae bacterium]